MGLNIQKSDSEIVRRPVAIAIFGDPGIGKTSLGFTAAKAIVFDYEEGIERAYKELRPDFDRFADWKKIKDGMEDGSLLADLKEGGYQTIIHDTVGTMIDRQIAAFVKSQNFRNSVKGGNALSMDGWMAAEQEFVMFFDFLRKNGFDQIFLSHAKGDGKEDKIVFEISGGAKKIVQKHSDAIGYYFADGVRGRQISFEPTQERIGKNPAGWGIKVVPSAEKPAFSTFLAEITADLKQSLFGRSKAQTEALEALKKIKARIESEKEGGSFAALLKLRPEFDALSPALRAQSIKLFNDRWALLFAKIHLNAASKLKDINLAYKSFSENFPSDILGTELATMVWKQIVATANAVGYNFVKETKKFVAADPNATTEGEEPEEEQDAKEGDE